MKTPPPRARRQASAESLADVLGEALALLETSVPTPARFELVPAEPEPSLLEQCLEMCSGHAAVGIEPVRTVHHFACTGGTLVSRCIAALPNVQLLSEVDPLSTMLLAGARHPFMPTDLIGLARRSTRGVDVALLVRIFHAAIGLIRADAIQRGCRLVLRDHAHSHFCLGDRIPARPTLRELLPPDVPVRSVVTVRHPVDSFASLQRNGWIAFEPASVEEYARRYMAFLDRYEGVPIVRYEDLLAEPVAAMARICDALELPMRDDFQDFQDLFVLSGDSGRSGGAIAERERLGDTAAVAAGSADEMAALCRRLGYDLGAAPEPGQ